VSVQLLFEGGPWANQLLDSSVGNAPAFVAPNPGERGAYRRIHQQSGAIVVVYEWLPNGSEEESRSAPLNEGIVRHEVLTERRQPVDRSVGDKGMRIRFALEVLGAVGALMLAIFTLFMRDWIEVVFRVEPDAGSGAMEWVVVFALAAISVGLTLAARQQWQRLRLAT
jgi:hypothetical protein